MSSIIHQELSWEHEVQPNKLLIVLELAEMLNLNVTTVYEPDNQNNAFYIHI